MQFRDLIKSFPHLRYVYDEMNFCTFAGRERMLSSLFITDVYDLESENERVSAYLGRDFKAVKALLSHLRDVKGTLARLGKCALLTEVELFELKYFAFYVNKLSECSEVNVSSLGEVFSILDPDRSGVVNFYIYDSYNPELTELRAKISRTDDDSLREGLFTALAREEEKVRIELSDKLFSYIDILTACYNAVAEIDMYIAKSELVKKWGLVRPMLSAEYKGNSYKAIFNPYLMSLVSDYQSIDVNLIPAPSLITGANMSGKTMLLKTVALAQYMVQFGLYAPASEAHVCLVHDVFLSVGDAQRESEGLSSYAAEILNVSALVEATEINNRYLVLIDELARTTSPREGAAIVDATLSILAERGVMSLISTHFSALESKVRKLRVVGFSEGKSDKRVTKHNISQFIDYSLYEVAEGEHIECSEAIRIAEILGVNEKLINKTKEFVCTKKVN